MTSTINEQSMTTRRWALDPTRSSAEFHVRHFWGLITVKGHVDRFAGSYDGNTIELAIDADSLDTGNKQRDKHLRSGDFFDVENHPQTTFRSTTITNTGDGTLHVEGELQAAGKTVPLSFEATLREQGDELELAATTTVDHARVAGEDASIKNAVTVPCADPTRRLPKSLTRRRRRTRSGYRCAPPASRRGQCRRPDAVPAHEARHSRDEPARRSRLQLKRRGPLAGTRRDRARTTIRRCAWM